MTNKICTTIEESKKLIELGLDINTADMYYLYDAFEKINSERPSVGHKCLEEDIPAWSLSALLNIISQKDFNIKSIENEFNIDIPDRHCKIWFSSLLDAAFEMVCWLKENNRFTK